MDYRLFNVRTNNVCDCTGGCTNNVKESALKVDSGAAPMLYQLNYVPIYWQ